MSWHRISRHGIRIAALLPLLAIAPLTLAPTEGIRENRACAADACVQRMGDVCYYGGNFIRDHYTRNELE